MDQPVYNWTGKGYTIDTNMIFNNLWRNYIAYIELSSQGAIGQTVYFDK